MNYLPVGIVGLLLAVVFCAAMSSTSSALNALASTAMVDMAKTSFKPTASDRHYVIASKGFTVLFGLLVVLFALFVSQFENLIQAVNIVGSIFYGPVLGVFMTAFFLKRVKGSAVFIAAIISQLVVIAVYVLSTESGSRFFGADEKIIPIEFLWLNPIGCLSVMGLGFLFSFFENKSK
jgi:Na+/proline symporter